MKTDTIEQIFGARFRRRDIISQHFHGKHDVFKRGQSGDKMVGLEDGSKFTTAEHRHLVFTEASDVRAVDFDGSGSWPVQSGDQTEQGAFATAGRSHDCDKLPIRDFRANITDDFNSSVCQLRIDFTRLRTTIMVAILHRWGGK